VFKGHRGDDAGVADFRRDRSLPLERAVPDLVGSEASRRIGAAAAGVRLRGRPAIWMDPPIALRRHVHQAGKLKVNEGQPVTLAGRFGTHERLELGTVAPNLSMSGC